MSRSHASAGSTAELEQDPALTVEARPAPAERSGRPGPRSRRGVLPKDQANVVAVILGGALAGVVFGAAGGLELTRTTITEVLMLIVSGAVVAAAVIRGRQGRLYGGTALALFGALSLLTALSVTWAMMPDLAYVEAGRTFAYLAVFAAALAGARLVPGAAPVVIKGILLAAIAAVVYALAARVWVGTIGSNELSNRIGQPFGYWNAVGTTAALAIPGLLWLGARPTGSVAGRVLAYPGMGAAMLAILLTQSRGALAAAVVGAMVWLAIVPVRLRSVPVILLPAAGAGALGAWALSKDAFAKTAQPLAVKQDVAGEFGLLLVLMTVVLVVAGLAVNVALARGIPSMHVRRRIGIVALVVTCGIPLAAFASVALSDRGIGGTIDTRVSELTSETNAAPTQQGAARFTAASSTRGKYWREAGRVFDDRPSIGLGAGNFATARLRHRKDASVTLHAHGFVPQTLADLGIVGLLVTTALLLAWLVAAARATALHPRRLPFLRHGRGSAPRRDWNGERIALVSLTLIALVYGLQSAIDWTWFVPGPTAMALVAAGFVAGRGPAPHAGTTRLAAPGSWKAPRPRVVAAAAVMVAALLTAWAAWQPEAADRATGDALALADAGQLDAAIAKTRTAADTDPLTAEPMLVQAAIETQANRNTAAEATLEDAVLKFPGDPQTWLRLAGFQLGTLDRPQDAVQTVRGTLFLDPLSQPGRVLFLQARARLREQQARRPRP